MTVSLYNRNAPSSLTVAARPNNRACVYVSTLAARALLLEPASAELFADNLVMLTQRAVVQAEPDDDGNFWCPEAGCSKSFADRHKQNFEGFRKYKLAYNHYWHERTNGNGHPDFYCKSATSSQTKRRLSAFKRASPNSPEQHNGTAKNVFSSECDVSPLVSQEQKSRSCTAKKRQLSSSSCLKQAGLPVISSADAADKDCSGEVETHVDTVSESGYVSKIEQVASETQATGKPACSSTELGKLQEQLENMPQHCQASVLVVGHVVGLISEEELRDAMRDNGPYALIVGQGEASHINTDMINKIKREGGRSLHTDRTASNTFLQNIYKRFNNRVSELTGDFAPNDEGYRLYQSVMAAERHAGVSFLEKTNSNDIV